MIPGRKRLIEKVIYIYIDKRRYNIKKDKGIEDINNIVNKSIKNIKNMELKKIKPKHLENLKEEIVKANNGEFYLDSNGLSSNLLGDLEVNIKLDDANNETDIKEDIIYKGKFNEYNYDEKYSLVDICEDNKENDIKNECYKKNVIENISENLEYKAKEEKKIVMRVSYIKRVKKIKIIKK